MLLKFVTSYVAKCHDAVKIQQLYSVDLGAYQAATSFLKNMHPLEPEMVLQLTSMKIAWSNSHTKPFTAPTPNQTQHKVHQKYLARPDDDEELTFLEWLRYYDHEKNPAKWYKDGTTLVGVKHFSVFNPVFFYQLLFMNMPHRTLDELRDPREDHLPKHIKHFVPASEKLPHILGSRDAILQCLSNKSHKRSYLDTIVLYIQSLQDIYTLWQLGVIDNTFATSERSQFEIQYPLSPQQRAIYTRYYSLVQARQRDIYGTWSTAGTPSSNQLADDNSKDYQKYQLLLGCPGTGKTQVVKRLVHTLIEEYSITVCAPLIIAGDECQQPPLQTINGRTTQTTSILKNRCLSEVCQIHSLYQQFRCTDKPYLDFLQYNRYSQPQQYVLDNFQRPLLMFHQSDITDYDIWQTVRDAPDAPFLTVSRAAANRVNSIVIGRMFQDKTLVPQSPWRMTCKSFSRFATCAWSSPKTLTNALAWSTDS